MSDSPPEPTGPPAEPRPQLVADPQRARRSPVNIWDRIKHHKLVQWTLAYLAIAYTLLHGAEMLTGSLGWPHSWIRIFTLLLILGVPVVITLAWYHGARGQQRASGTEIMIIAILLAIGGLVLSRDGVVTHDEQIPGSDAGADKAAATTTMPHGKSIAVLPFVDMSADRNQQYMSDGIAEEILNLLAQADGLRVIARTSSFSFKEKSLPVAEIARQLNVAYVLEGSVRVDDDRIRISVQLIEAQTDQNLWADSFDRLLSVQNIFSIQEEVARQIVQVFQQEYANVAEPQPVQLPTANLDAYNAFLLGRYHTFKQTPEDLELAVINLERATSLDPNFAEAFATLGWSYSFLGTNFGNLLPSDVYPKAKEAALKAIALDGDLPDARSLYADILTWYDWDFEAAEREYRKAMDLDPMNVLGYALFLSIHKKHEEALQLVERVLQGYPDEQWGHVNAAWLFLHADHYDRAIKEAELAGNHSDARAAMGSAWLAKGDTERAISYFESDLAARGRQPQQIANLARAYYQADGKAQADELLTELKGMAATRFVSPGLLALVYFAAGDADSGFASLRAAVDAKVRDVLFLRGWGVLDAWRDDPRYVDLIQTIGFSAAR